MHRDLLGHRERKVLKVYKELLVPQVHKALRDHKVRKVLQVQLRQ